MAAVNRITKANPGAPALGVPMEIPVDRLHDISVILRVVLALSDDDTQTLITQGEAYEVLVRRLEHYHNNLNDVAKRIREVTHYA